MSVQNATLNMLEAVNDIVSKARSIHKGIPETVVVLGASGVTRSGQKHGHFAPRSWKPREAGEEKKYYGEIFLAGESLERGAEGTLGTILHELAHAYCDAHDIMDTSNNHRYHNNKFKTQAEEFGLVIEKADTIGWSITSVPEATKEVYREELDKLEATIKVARLGYSELQSVLGTEKEKKKQKVYKMQCPTCEVPLTVTKKWWTLQGNGGEDMDYGTGLLCVTHEELYEIYLEE